MAEYERRRFVAAQPDALFAYLSDVHNLPVYFRGMRSAEPGRAPGEVIVTATVKDMDVAGAAHLEVDAGARRMEWSSEGPNDYHGWLQVRPRDDGAEVELHVSTVRVQTGEVDEGLDRSLDVIARIVGTHAAPVAGAG
ncbi:MAG: SRPBCC family protein [Chloroflexota bacterium]